MSTADINKSVLEIVNAVQERLGLNKTSTLYANKHARTLVGLFNEVIDELCGLGDWQQMYREWTVTAQSSVGTYVITPSANVQRIEEIVWNNDIAPLSPINPSDMRRQQRLSMYGNPRQFSIIGVSGADPKFRVSPVPTTAASFSIAGYKKLRRFDADVTADASAVPNFPATMLIQGLYAKALLEEAGGEPTQQFQTEYAEYIRMRREALNMFTTDTGTTMQLVPE